MRNVSIRLKRNVNAALTAELLELSPDRGSPEPQAMEQPARLRFRCVLHGAEPFGIPQTAILRIAPMLAALEGRGPG